MIYLCIYTYILSNTRLLKRLCIVFITNKMLEENKVFIIFDKVPKKKGTLSALHEKCKTWTEKRARALWIDHYEVIVSYVVRRRNIKYKVQKIYLYRVYTYKENLYSLQIYISIFGTPHFPFYQNICFIKSKFLTS